MSISEYLGQRKYDDLNPLLLSCLSIWSREILNNRIEDEGGDEVLLNYGIPIEEIDRLYMWWATAPAAQLLIKKLQTSLVEMLSRSELEIEFVFENWSQTDYWSDFIPQIWDNNFDPDYPEVDWFANSGIRSKIKNSIDEEEFSNLVDEMEDWIQSEDVARIFLWFHEETIEIRSTIKYI
jgi:hypothetical protein